MCTHLIQFRFSGEAQTVDRTYTSIRPLTKFRRSFGESHARRDGTVDKRLQ
jgi:hypothetical protein